MKTSVNYKKKSKRSRARKRRFTAFAVFLVLAVAAFVVARTLLTPRPPVVVAKPSTPAPVATPAPATWMPADVAALHKALNAALGPAASGAVRKSIVVVDAAGNVLYSQDANAVVAPASVQKLIVAYVALNVLGTQFRFDTIFAAPHAIDRDGSLDGPLWFVGSGDPSLRSDDLRGGILALQRDGLRSVSNGVGVDATAIQGPEINPYWDRGDANEDFQTATSGASLDGDTAEFRVYGTATGAPARVAILPESDAVRVFGSVSTGSGDDVTIASYVPNQFHLSGDIPPGIEEKFWLPVHDMGRYAGSVVERMLRDAGIALSGGPSTGSAPLDSVTLWLHRSAPLPVLLHHMLFFSDNHYAEQLLRTLGGQSGTPDDAHGVASEIEFLRARNVPVGGLHLVDGSGLAESNRVSAMALARILSDAELRSGGAQLYPLLAAPGQGTLKYYRFAAARGRVRAKTGHLSDADSLAGYIDTKHHGRLSFAFMINNSPGDPDSAYVRALDELAEF